MRPTGFVVAVERTPTSGSPRAVLDAGLAAAAVELDEAARAALIRYVELLARWNRAYNLTAVRAPREMVRRHLLDSVVILPYVHGRRLLDVGTGAGLPGLVVALARPELECVLIDSSAKKIRFCRQAVGELRLANVEVVHARIQEYRPARPFDTVVARAFGRLGELLAQAERLCAPGGRLLAMKGKAPRAELADLGALQERTRVVPLRVPGLDARRELVIVPCGPG
ncbi:MAG: 16S rRNA (guanine(527)-N(7))-methyltransferase RsmG [Gammaproteobacteria bacterium]|nr:16S rRNA (guanine(527)-N(7))-methyltransferase RsmG [Gammaproteobacteria bacterium]NIR83298.1 16S rRNA (guanine(527)-N(7))-methyltransferase RsmG [Gammaproteobacteria bacterium]NIR91098.1 16S rRNA (guanine(527)-N(7))-methyltransferase RsmG [Gammaproteobacteria bacterium]NIU04465.1 16S rRNA (guanine(527)-N(7))-methyltransferase RsmG [Gammaproteobacteria bacterium]NIW87101.1 16S rRNA (guanine(527)-N(7))-methyltransferase RsmG [Gammaproteobacteria bacterium]